MTPRALLGLAADALFPPRCLLCDEVLGFLPECPACRGELARLSRGHAPGIACAPPALDGAFACGWGLKRDARIKITHKNTIRTAGISSKSHHMGKATFRSL